MVGTRDTPPSIQDGEFGFEPRSFSHFEERGDDQIELDPETAQRLGREIWDSSTNWINAGRRAKWNDNLRSFQSLHPSGSKYLSRDFSYRSTLYRPKTRAMVRKAEAQTAAAFFSNEDVVSITAEDDDDPRQQASAELLQALLQYRLTKSVPWFLTLVGARQDCEVMGIACAKAYWKYEEKKVGERLQPKLDGFGAQRIGLYGQPEYDTVDILQRIHDKPVVDLIAPENIRFEPGCDWRDVVGTSPYIIQNIPMYIQDVQERIDKGEWFEVTESAIRAATNLDDDVTRRSRETGRVPGQDHDAWKPRAFDIAWVRENIVKWHGEDWQFYTLGSAGELLSNPRPLKEVYLHGSRPYVIGCVVMETHKTYPASKIELVRDLQRAANDDWNLRFDQLKLSLNPRQFVAQGSGIEIADVRTFMPGKVVMVKKPQEDVVWDRPPEPSAAAYQEQDRINLDFDELVGDFSNSSVRASEVNEQSATGMHLMSGQASGMNEYELRVFSETFAEPLMRLLIKLEQAYETDPVVLAIAGKRAQIWQKYGVSQITDELLDEDVTVRCNVGIGATNPQMKLKNFMMGAEIIGNLFGPVAAQGANFEEVSKEVFSMCGFKDGARFFQPGFDPHKAMLQQELAKAQGKAQGQQGKVGQMPDPMRLQAAQVTAQSNMEKQKLASQTDLQIAQLKFREAMMGEQMENQRAQMQYQREMQRDRERLQQQTMMHQQRQQMAMMRPAQPPQTGAGGQPPI